MLNQFNQNKREREKKNYAVKTIAPVIVRLLIDVFHRESSTLFAKITINDDFLCFAQFEKVVS